MATLYADRAFVSVNGAQIADLQSASLKQTFNAKAVPTMTPDSFNRGFVQGNTDIDITFELAIQNTLASPKLESLPFKTADIQITFLVGVDQYVATGLFVKDTDSNASGIGTEVKKTYNFGAIKLVDAIGNSSLFSLIL